MGKVTADEGTLVWQAVNDECRSIPRIHAAISGDRRVLVVRLVVRMSDGYDCGSALADRVL